MNIGVFGGSFDPVHFGHICLAQDAIEQANLDEVIFVPARIQPFKQNRTATDGSIRVEMLKLASEGTDHLKVSDFELTQQGVSYTYLTLRHMKETYDKIAAENNDTAKIFFICGTDSFLKLELWSESEEILRNYSYIIGSRPGYKQMELQETMVKMKEKYGTESINIHNRLKNISATEIRERIKTGQSIHDLVPAAVEKYINENGLYR